MRSIKCVVNSARARAHARDFSTKRNRESPRRLSRRAYNAPIVRDANEKSINRAAVLIAPRENARAVVSRIALASGGTFSSCASQLRYTNARAYHEIPGELN